jgi:hypothetical protein
MLKKGRKYRPLFGRLPVLLNGRIQPFDSVARNTLLQIRSTGDVPLEEVPSWKFWHHPKKLKSTEWLLEVNTRLRPDTRPIFLIHHLSCSGTQAPGQGRREVGPPLLHLQRTETAHLEIDEQARKAGEVSRGADQLSKQVGKLANASRFTGVVHLQPEARRISRSSSRTSRRTSPGPGGRSNQRQREGVRQGNPSAHCRAAAGIPVDGPVRLPAHRAPA